MNDLSREGRELLRALVAGPRAWQTPAELSRRLGRDLDATTDLLCELDLDGWLALWEDASGIRVTLSPRAAERFDVHLAGASAGVEAPHGRSRPQETAPRRPSPAVSGLLAGLPGSSQTIAPGVPPQTGPRAHDDTAAACPDCGGERLGPQRYCVTCDRWNAGAADASPATDRADHADAPPRRRRRRRRRNPQVSHPGGDLSPNSPHLRHERPTLTP